METALEYIDIARRFIAILVAVTFIPAFGYWFVIHPFAGLWRRVGRKWAMAAGFLAILTGMAACTIYRQALIGADLGTLFWLWLPALALLSVAGYIERVRKRHLTWAILTGAPELSGEAEEQTLLDQGIYARMRHPRYTAFLLSSLGYALIANYRGLYLYVAVFWALIFVLTVIEERELRVRFGREYEDYARKVPRLIPRLR